MPYSAEELTAILACESGPGGWDLYRGDTLRASLHNMAHLGPRVARALATLRPGEGWRYVPYTPPLGPLGPLVALWPAWTRPDGLDLCMHLAPMSGRASVTPAMVRLRGARGEGEGEPLAAFVPAARRGACPLGAGFDWLRFMAMAPDALALDLDRRVASGASEAWAYALAECGRRALDLDRIAAVADVLARLWGATLGPTASDGRLSFTLPGPGPGPGDGLLAGTVEPGPRIALDRLVIDPGQWEAIAGALGLSPRQP